MEDDVEFMKQHLLSIMRDKRTDSAEFRRASDALAPLVCAEAFAKLPHATRPVVTPVGVAQGVSISSEIMVVPILRSGLTFLPAVKKLMPGVSLGVLGMKRDEKTAEAHAYYKGFPKTLPRRAMILDHMFATGGSAMLALDELFTNSGYKADHVYFCGTVAAPEGVARLAERIPRKNITVVAVDERLNDKKYIVPGLGDFGDRYFGHSNPLSYAELAEFLEGEDRWMVDEIIAATSGM